MASKLSKNPEVRKLQKQRRRERIKARKAADPEFRKRFNRRKALQAKYGISPEDYDFMREAQGNKCAICGLGPEPGEEHFDVDHNHVYDHVRGLLCGPCNRGIGKFKEDVRLLQRAIDYLNAHGSIHE